jgi:hypothetical protein
LRIVAENKICQLFREFFAFLLVINHVLHCHSSIIILAISWLTLDGTTCAIPLFTSSTMKAAQKARLKLRCPISLGRDPQITIPDGWFTLVYQMCADIEDIAQQIKRKRRQRLFLPRISFIEEQMGKLACEVINSNRDIAAIIKQAQMRSVQLCMYCGNEARQFRRDGSLITCCDRHRRQFSL